MEAVYERCCGIDVHRQTVVACVMVPDADPAQYVCVELVLAISALLRPTVMFIVLVHPRVASVTTTVCGPCNTPENV